jgi:hypothetical protein
MANEQIAISKVAWENGRFSQEALTKRPLVASFIPATRNIAIEVSIPTP